MSIKALGTTPPLTTEQIQHFEKVAEEAKNKLAKEFTEWERAQSTVEHLPYDSAEFQEALEVALLSERSRREAKRIVEAEGRPPAVLPQVLTLRERLARPRDPLPWRVEGWQPAGGRVVLVAQFKAGKTTLVGNLVRVLADGGLFLGRDLAHPVPGAVAIVDTEMPGAKVETWLAEQKIINDDRVLPLTLRGATGAFNIIDPDRRAEWAKLLRERDVAYLVLDCLRPVLDALGLDEHRDAGRFLTAFDALLSEAGIGEACVVHHMGHTNERSRGDSRIRDWPDAEWRVVRQDEDPRSPRYIAAYGRDVDQPEQQLHFTEATRHLTIQAGNRREAGIRDAQDAVMELLRETPGRSGNQVETALSGTHSRGAIRRALELGALSGQLTRQPGSHNATLYSLSAGPTSTEGYTPRLPIMPVTSSSTQLASSPSG